ncbi:MAG: exodeoxyribonuclease VII small subunit [Planctomycetota bacterium]|jgi:exodeoxyribonuclease VII small subunit
MSQKKQKFEDHLAKVEEVVRALEEGSLGLDESMEKYEEGVAALKNCYRLLEQAEIKIRMLVKQKDGSLAEKKFEPEGGSKRKK